MVNSKELKTILKENKIHFYSYWRKKKLIGLAVKHGLLAEEAPKREKSKDPKFDRLKTIMHNPRKVSLEDVETGEKKKTFPSIYKAGKFIDQSPQRLFTGMVKFGRISIRLRSNNLIMFMHKHNEIGIRFYIDIIK